MSNLVTKSCDHKTCEKLYASDSNNWWWAYRENQVILFGMFHTSITLTVDEPIYNQEYKGRRLDRDTITVLHFCGQEHLMSWVNENVGRIIETHQKETAEAMRPMSNR